MILSSWSKALGRATPASWARIASLKAHPCLLRTASRSVTRDSPVQGFSRAAPYSLNSNSDSSSTGPSRNTRSSHGHNEDGTGQESSDSPGVTGVRGTVCLAGEERSKKDHDESNVDAPPVQSKPRLFEAMLTADKSTRKVLWVVLGAEMAYFCCAGLVTPALPVVCEQVAGVGTSGVGMLLSANALGQLFLNLQMGLVADKVGRKLPVMVGNITSAAGEVVTAAAQSMSGLVGGRALVGVGEATSNAAGSAYLADVTGRVPQHRGLIVGAVSSAGMLAYALGPGAGGYLTQTFGAGAPFLLAGCLWLGSAAAYATVPETLKDRVSVREFAKSLRGEQGQQGLGNDDDDDDGVCESPLARSRAGGGSPTKPESLVKGFLALMKRPHLQSIYALDVFAGVSWAVFLTVVPLHTMQSYHVDIADLGMVLSLGAAFGIAGSAFGGWASDRVKQRMTVVGAGIAMSTASVFSMMFIEQVELFAAAVVLWNFANGLKSAALNAHAAEVVKDVERGRTYALRQQFDSIILMLAPISLGFIADIQGHAAAFGASTAVMVACGAFVGLNSKRAQKEILLPKERRVEKGETRK